MATKNHTVSNASDFGDPMSLETRLNLICIEMEGIKDILNRIEDDAPEVSNVLFMVVKALGRINDDLNEIAGLTKPIKGASHD